jgi:S-adenosyl methyltransferase
MGREFNQMAETGAEIPHQREAESADRYGTAEERIDSTVAHPARRYNYWLGGKAHFAADRESGDAVLAVFPTARAAALENRAFMGRAVRYLVREAGIRQFLDIGTGIPAPNNTHEVAQAIAPESRVVYVDNDPIVTAHARALLAGTPQGRTAYIEADLRDYQSILEHPQLRATIDLSRPVALLLVAVLHFVPDEEDPYAIVRGLVAALPPGSYLVVSHANGDHTTLDLQAQIVEAMPHGSIYAREGSEFSRFFNGLELVDPGVVSTADWRPTDPDHLSPAEAGATAAVARKP